MDFLDMCMDWPGREDRQSLESLLTVRPQKGLSRGFLIVVSRLKNSLDIGPTISLIFVCVRLEHSLSLESNREI
jgi:hypothetical protein